VLYLNLPFGSAHGWGVCGRYLARELSRLEPVRVISEPFSAEQVGDVLDFHELQGLLVGGDPHGSMALLDGTLEADGPLLQGICDERLLPRRPRIRAKIRIGYTFFERNVLKPESLENGRRLFDRVVTGSTWCMTVLKEAGLLNVQTVVQGIDPALFHLALEENRGREFLRDKFVIFSGGKFELRKGQDIVIRACRVLQDRHSDVVLVNAWFNPWETSFETMRGSSLIRFSPRGRTYEQMVQSILSDNGLDLRRVITCPRQPNLAMPRIYHNTDVGLFPNRCEGGTNLVLMEYMACGKPVVAVNTTGHADIVNDLSALIIGTKGTTMVRDRDGNPEARWPEPDVNDVIDKLEWAYQHRDEMRRLGERAGADLALRTWRKTAEAFRRIIQETSEASSR
jgi:glycosyltransferase involved in cell wall biosynthesis